MKEFLSPSGRTAWRRSGLGMLGATYAFALVAYAGALVALENPPKDDTTPIGAAVKHVAAGSSGVIAAGVDSPCALAAGSVQRSGEIGVGQFGNNSTAESRVPASVSGWAP